MTRWIILLALLTLSAGMLMGLSRSKGWLRPHLRLAALLVAIFLAALAVGCEDYVNPININPVVNGTPSGTYTITLTGTLGDVNAVQRTTTVNLSVLPTT
jgi:hypothetical protein